MGKFNIALFIANANLICKLANELAHMKIQRSVMKF